MARICQGAEFDKFCFSVIQWSCPQGSERSTISGRRLTLPHKGGDADVAESGASHRLDSDLYRVYALHFHHKSKIAALAKVTAILL